MGAKREGGAENTEGWAWVETPEMSDRGVIEAYRLADFVKNTLRIQANSHTILQRFHLKLAATSHCPYCWPD